MKIFRFLTTLLTLQIIALGGSIRAQEIAEYEFRKSNPSRPFKVASEILPLDNNGIALPVNQCSESFEAAFKNRCGFSAEASTVSLAKKPTAVTPVKVAAKTNRKSLKNGAANIDLSPLTFECFQSGCEYEYESSERAIAKRRPKLENFESTPKAQRELARKMIDRIFHSASHINDVIASRNEPVKNQFEYIPYVEPTTDAGIDPFSEFDPQPVSTRSNLRILMNAWSESIRNVELIHSPQQACNKLILDLECQWCGTPASFLYYNFRDELIRQNHELVRKHQVEAQQHQTNLVRGFARLLRSMGQNLIETSDQIEKISGKGVEVSLNR